MPRKKKKKKRKKKRKEKKRKEKKRKKKREIKRNNGEYQSHFECIVTRKVFGKIRCN